MINVDRWKGPGWPEMLAGLAAYGVLLLLFGLLMGWLPANDPVLLGVVGSTAGGVVGVGAPGDARRRQRHGQQTVRRARSATKDG